MGKFVVEILKEVNEKPELLAQYKDNAALRMCLEYAFDPAKKWILPEGRPPFKEDPAPLGMSPANFQQEIRRFAVFMRADLTVLRRETLYIQLLEGVHKSEADLLIAIKDQKLPSLYPNVTLESIQAVGILTELKKQALTDNKSPEGAVAPAAKRGRGRPSGAKNKTKSEDKAE